MYICIYTYLTVLSGSAGLVQFPPSASPSTAPHEARPNPDLQPHLLGNRPVLYCIVLYCIVLYCRVVYCIVLYCIV